MAAEADLGHQWKRRRWRGAGGGGINFVAWVAMPIRAMCVFIQANTHRMKPPVWAAGEKRE